MKKLIIGAAILAMAVTVGGCGKKGAAAKKPAAKPQPAATGTMEHKAATPAHRKTTKPAAPAAGAPSKAERAKPKQKTP